MYGTPIDAALNATANVPGVFTYTPPPGTILDAGTGRDLRAEFTPYDLRNHELVAVSTAIDVLKGAQTISWAEPAAIVYGTPLSEAQLNANAAVSGPSAAGVLTYAPAAGTLLEASPSHVLTVRAAETTNYEPALASVQIAVLKATPILEWPSPSSIVYGALLGDDQLNASANVAGRFVYEPVAGTLLEAGAHTLTVRFIPLDTRNFEEVSASTVLIVNRAMPKLEWNEPSGIVYGTSLGAAQLNARADVVGTFVYSPDLGSILDAGPDQTLSVHFIPADTRNYEEADAATTIDVAKATQTIVWPRPASIVYGEPLSSEELNATVEVVGPAPAGALTYAPPAGTVLDAGAGIVLSATAAETRNYESAANSVTIDVQRKQLSLEVAPKSKLYGAPLPSLTGVLTGVVNSDRITPAYETTATQQSAAGTYPITATLVDPDHRLVNYDVTVLPAVLTILPAPLTVTANHASKQYSDPVPVLTVAYAGFVLGETPAVLDGTVVTTTEAGPLSAPGSYPIRAGGLASSNYLITYVPGTLTVNQEDARVAIIAPRVVAMQSGAGVPVTLTATVQDISATTEAGGDLDPGDIRNATLTFVDRTTGADLCTAPIGLLNDADSRIGAASCSAVLPPASVLPTTVNIGARVGAWYLRDDISDDVKINQVASGSGAVTGGATVPISSSAGTHAPDPGSKARIQVNLQTAKSGLVKGNLTFSFVKTVQGLVRRYELEATVSSLAVTPTVAGGSATILGAGTVRDVTVPEVPVLVVDGAPVLLEVTDGGEPSVTDRVAVILTNPAGGLWLATGWSGVRPIEQYVEDGNLMIHERK